MKKLPILLALIFVFGLIMSSCGAKPAYKTRDGKKKLKYYNELQYHGD